MTYGNPSPLPPEMYPWKADSRLANLILRDCAKEATVVVGGCSTAGSRCVRTTGFRPKVKNLILVYKNGDAIDLDYLGSFFGNRWNPRARVIVCVGKIVERTALEILSYFWKRDLLNVALTVQSENRESSSENFIYNPFVPRESPAGSRGILKRLNPGDDVFPDKLTDLYNETIPISVFFHFPKSILMNFSTPREGADIEVLAALSKKLNFSVALKTAKVFAPSYTVTLSNGEKVGMIGDVLINRSVIVLSAQYMETTMGRNVEFTYPTLQTTQLVLVPKARVMPMLVRMLQPYPEEIWIAELSVVGFLLICFALMGEDNKVMKLLNLLLHHTFGKIFDRTFNRVFCISCIWWAYLMATVYQATLTKELLAPQYYKDLNTLEELYESKLPLIVGDNMMEVLNNSEVPALKNLAKRAVKHLVLDDCTRQLLRSFNVSCASDEYVVHLLSNFYKKNNAIMIHPVKEYLSRHWDVYVTKYGFPLLDKFNQHIQGLLEAGLYGKWVTDVLKKQFNKKGHD
ncbi:uncharacterized protein LOC105683354 [Athalia rosae]|uniref:uncharacterized protein LOC105683354 n=1 Tax=Athalia rosae TaxID=37344 RepID=UPI0020338276|nr:uncharacterized protein LOC105683354 [Athalia rosae]